MRTCGSCKAGIIITRRGRVRACQTCKLFETDRDATAAVTELVKVLARVYDDGETTSTTVADALDNIVLDAAKKRIPETR